jgi:hypothetical protein
VLVFGLRAPRPPPGAPPARPPPPPPPPPQGDFANLGEMKNS